MHFARTEEQDELAAIVASLLDKRSGSEAVRAAMESEAGYDESLWQAMCEQVGVAALPVPEEYDGFGASLVETAIVLEELGRNLAPSPLLATRDRDGGRARCTPTRVAPDLLPAIAAGEVATLALDDLVLDAPAADWCCGCTGSASSVSTTRPVEHPSAPWTRRCGWAASTGEGTR